MRPMPELSVTTVPVDELVPYAGNAKMHPTEQVEQIMASIEEFGNCDPIAVWHNDEGEPEIVEGHGRLLALRRLGIAEAPVITLDHLTDEQRRAYTLAHNRLTMNSGFDLDVLRDELESIADIDMGDFGFYQAVEESVDEILGSKEVEDILSEEVEGELPFTEYVDESSNYVVLKFRTDEDWLRAQSVLGLERVSGFSTKEGGEPSFSGIGRVVDGNEAFRRIAETEMELSR